MRLQLLFLLLLTYSCAAQNKVDQNKIEDSTQQRVEKNKLINPPLTFEKKEEDKSKKEESKDWLFNLLSGALGGLIISLILFAITNGAEKKRLKKQVVLELYKHFFSPDFYKIRMNVNKVKKLWNDNDITKRTTFRNSIVGFFIMDKDDNYTDLSQILGNAEPKTSNELSLEQNLALLLYFYSEAHLNEISDRIDKEIFVSTFGHFHNWNKTFFEELVNEYKNQIKSKQNEKPPIWVEAIPKINSWFKR